jgi:uncharacterized membrane protein YedE/YeeE
MLDPLALPTICLFCGHQRPRGAIGFICPRCRQRVPEGTWSFEDGKTPAARIRQAIKLTLLSLAFMGAGGWLVVHAVTSARFGLWQALLVLLGLLLVLVACLVVSLAVDTAFLRRHRFQSHDGRVDAHVHTFMGRVRWVVAESFRAARVNLDLAPAAKALDSASAAGALPALRALARDPAIFGTEHEAPSEVLVAMAAIVGMGARREIDLLAARPGGYGLDRGQISRLPTEQRSARLWVRAGASGSSPPPLPFERAFYAHLIAMDPPGGPHERGDALGFRERRSDDEGDGGVLLTALLERHAASSMVIGDGLRAELRPEGSASVPAEELAAAFMAALRVNAAAATALRWRVQEIVEAAPRINLSTATGGSGRARASKKRPLDELLASRELGPLPEALRPTPPRPDVFSRKGYLKQRRHRDRYLPLLLHGHAARGLCLSYHSSGDADGIDVTFTYAWLDHTGALRQHSGKESYDPMHAALGSGQGDIVVSMDASLDEGRVFTVVYDEREHVIYEALKID